MMTSEVYVTELLKPFIAQVKEEQRNYAFSQKDGATTYVSSLQMAYGHEAFGQEYTVSSDLQPPRSPDLATRNFYL